MSILDLLKNNQTVNGLVQRTRYAIAPDIALYYNNRPMNPAYKLLYRAAFPVSVISGITERSKELYNLARHYEKRGYYQCAKECYALAIRQGRNDRQRAEYYLSLRALKALLVLHPDTKQAAVSAELARIEGDSAFQSLNYQAYYGVSPADTLGTLSAKMREGKIAGKVISTKGGDVKALTDLDFFFLQLAHPVDNRPRRNHGQDRTRRFNPRTNSFHGNLPRREPTMRGLSVSAYPSEDDVDTHRYVPLKKTAMSLMARDGLNPLFNRNRVVGLLFDLDFCDLKGEKYFFYGNQITNNRGWLGGSWEYEGCGRTRAQIHAENERVLNDPDLRFAGHNECLTAPRRAAVVGVFAAQNTWQARVCAWHAREYLKSSTGMNVPVYVSDGVNPIRAYTQGDFDADIERMDCVKETRDAIKDKNYLLAKAMLAVSLRRGVSKEIVGTYAFDCYRNGWFDLLDMVLKHDVDLNVKHFEYAADSKKSLCGVLHLAIIAGDLGVVNKLLSKGADASRVFMSGAHKGHSPLYLALKYQHVAIAEKLRRAGAAKDDPTCVDVLYRQKKYEDVLRYMQRGFSVSQPEKLLLGLVKGRQGSNELCRELLLRCDMSQGSVAAILTEVLFHALKRGNLDLITRIQALGVFPESIKAHLSRDECFMGVALRYNAPDFIARAMALGENIFDVKILTSFNSAGAGASVFKQFYAGVDDAVFKSGILALVAAGHGRDAVRFLSLLPEAKALAYAPILFDALYHRNNKSGLKLLVSHYPQALSGADIVGLRNYFPCIFKSNARALMDRSSVPYVKSIRTAKGASDPWIHQIGMSSFQMLKFACEHLDKPTICAGDMRAQLWLRSVGLRTDVSVRSKRATLNSGLVSIQTAASLAALAEMKKLMDVPAYRALRKHTGFWRLGGANPYGDTGSHKRMMRAIQLRVRVLDEGACVDEVLSHRQVDQLNTIMRYGNTGIFKEAVYQISAEQHKPLNGAVSILMA
jgi:hypothetical protein